MDRFDKPTNQWIEEEVDMPIFKPEVNEAEGRVEFKQTTKKVKQRTFYADSPQKRVICNKHSFICLDIHKYLYKCTRCDWHRIAPPITYRFDPDTNTIANRQTGQLL